MNRLQYVIALASEAVAVNAVHLCYISYYVAALAFLPVVFLYAATADSLYLEAFVLAVAVGAFGDVVWRSVYRFMNWHSRWMLRRLRERGLLGDAVAKLREGGVSEEAIRDLIEGEKK